MNERSTESSWLITLTSLCTGGLIVCFQAEFQPDGWKWMDPFQRHGALVTNHVTLLNVNEHPGYAEIRWTGDLGFYAISVDIWFIELQCR